MPCKHDVSLLVRCEDCEHANVTELEAARTVAGLVRAMFLVSGIRDSDEALFRALLAYDKVASNA